MINYHLELLAFDVTSAPSVSCKDTVDFGPISGRSDVWPFLTNQDLADISKAALHVDCLLLKVMKLVLACHHLSALS